MESKSAENAHLKLLASDLLSGNGAPASRVESVGVVVLRDAKPGKFLRFSLDDGTACLPCVLWLNHLTSPYFSRRRPLDVRVIAQMADALSHRAQLGLLLRVRGRVSLFRGSLQLTVEDVVVERDPNAQILHWLQCLRLAGTRSDAVVVAPE